MTIDLDVREMVHGERHGTIFHRLADLETGQTLRLTNDHDPVPLRYQIDAQWPDHYRWEYVESGPERWVVDITSRARVFDARPILASGGEPFGDIMAAVAELDEDEIFVLHAPFDPIPLQGVLSEQGFRYVVDQLDESNWRVIFLRQ